MTILKTQKQKYQIKNSKNAICCFAPQTAQLLLRSNYTKAIQNDLSPNELFDYYAWKICKTGSEICSKSCVRRSWPNVGVNIMDKIICQASEQRKYVVADEATNWYKAQRDLEEEKTLSRQEAVLEHLQSQYKGPIVQASKFRRISPQFLYLLQRHADMLVEEYKSIPLISNRWNFIYYPVNNKNVAANNRQLVSFAESGSDCLKDMWSCKDFSSEDKVKLSNCGKLTNSSPSMRFITESELQQCSNALALEPNNKGNVGSKLNIAHRREDKEPKRTYSELQQCCKDLAIEYLSKEHPCKAFVKDNEKQASKKDSKVDCNKKGKGKQTIVRNSKTLLYDSNTERKKRQKSGQEDNLVPRQTSCGNIVIKKSIKPILKKPKSILKSTKTLTYAQQKLSASNVASSQVSSDTVVRQSRATKRNACALRSPTPHPVATNGQEVSENTSAQAIHEIYRRPQYRRELSEEQITAFRTMKRLKGKNKPKRLFAGFDEANDSLASIVGSRPIISLHELVKKNYIKQNINKTNSDLGVAGYSDLSLLKEQKIEMVHNSSDDNSEVELQDKKNIKNIKNVEINKSKNLLTVNVPKTTKIPIFVGSIKKNEGPTKIYSLSDTDILKTRHRPQEFIIQRTSTLRDFARPQRQQPKECTIYRNERFQDNISSSSGLAATENSASSEAYDIDNEHFKSISKTCKLCKDASKLLDECYSELYSFSRYCNSRHCRKPADDGYCRCSSLNRDYKFPKRPKCIRPCSPDITIPRQSVHDASDQNIETATSSEAMAIDYGKKMYSTSDIYSSEESALYRPKLRRYKPKSSYRRVKLVDSKSSQDSETLRKNCINIRKIRSSNEKSKYNRRRCLLDFERDEVKKFKNRQRSRGGKHKSETSTLSSEFIDSNDENKASRAEYLTATSSVEVFLQQNFKQKNIKCSKYKTPDLKHLKNKENSKRTTSSKTFYDYDKNYAKNYRDDLSYKSSLSSNEPNVKEKYLTASTKTNLKSKPPKKQKYEPPVPSQCKITNSYKKIEKPKKIGHSQSKTNKAKYLNSNTPKESLSSHQEKKSVSKTKGRSKNSLNTSESFKHKMSQILQEKLVMIVDGAQIISNPSIQKKAYKNTTQNHLENAEKGKVTTNFKQSELNNKQQQRSVQVGAPKKTSKEISLSNGLKRSTTVPRKSKAIEALNAKKQERTIATQTPRANKKVTTKSNVYNPLPDYRLGDRKRKRISLP